MKRSNVLRAALLGGVAILLVLAGSTVGACNDPGTCPAKESIQPGGACSDEELQCAYDLVTPSTACDGTSTTLATSCICTSGAWNCPSPFECTAGDDGGGDAPPGDDGGGEAGDDSGGEAGDDGGGEASSDAPPG